jgi:hypothetical protein
LSRSLSPKANSAETSALFEFSFKPPEMKKAGPLSYEGTGTIGTIFPLKINAGDPSAWCWGSPAKGGGTD